MKEKYRDCFKKAKELYFGPQVLLSAKVFYVLVIASMLFCLVIAAVNALGDVGVVSVVVDLFSAAFCAGILWYARTGKRTRQCQLISIICVFFGLFPYLYFQMGGYHGGITAFMLFAAVYTVFMLEGWLAFGMTALELVFYGGIYIFSYRHPELVKNFPTEEGFLRSNLMDLLIVGITLCVTMYLQVRLYQKQQKKLDQQNQVLSQVNLSKTQFLANASHEMKTPLTVVSVNIQTVMHILNHMEEKDPEAAQLLNDAQEEIMGLSRMVNGMLSLASVTESTEKKRCSLTTIVKDSADMLRLLLKKRDNILYVCAEEGMEVFADADLLSQVLVNLLQNANAHTQRDEIRIRAFYNGSQFQVEVEDHGSGIRKELLPHVFERGVSDGGTGFGLFLCKTVVESHHGKIWIESMEGEGTTVFFTLPGYEGQLG